MTVAELREEVVAGLLALAWDQWSQLGVSAPQPKVREEHAADPEALVLFTLHVGRHDPRLFDAVLDWLATNWSIVSVQRLRNLCADDVDRALAGAAEDWSKAAQRPAAAARARGAKARKPLPLFPGLPAPDRDRLDPIFARRGLAREPLTWARKAQAPRAVDPIAFALRLRQLLGVGVRAEVMRALLTIHAPRLAVSVVTASAAFSARNVRDSLAQLQEAGAIGVVQVSGHRYYSVDSTQWLPLLSLPDAPSIPLHYDWIPAFRALTRILRWLEDPALEALSPYLLASRAQTLVDEIDDELRHIRVPPNLFAARGADFWTQFAEIARAAIREVAHAR